MNDAVASVTGFDAGFGTTTDWRCEVCNAPMGMWDTILYWDGEYKACSTKHARILHEKRENEVRSARRNRG